jgi:hypothetical protein
MNLICKVFGHKENECEEISIFQTERKKVVKNNLKLTTRCKRCDKDLSQRVIKSLSLRQLIEELK